MQLGALGLGTVLFQFSVGFFVALIIGTTPRVAAAHADSKRQASRAVASSVWLALLLGGALQAVVWAKAPDIVACECRQALLRTGLAGGCYTACHSVPLAALESPPLLLPTHPCVPPQTCLAATPRWPALQCSTCAPAPGACPER